MHGSTVRILALPARNICQACTLPPLLLRDMSSGSEQLHSNATATYRYRAGQVIMEHATPQPPTLSLKC
jgi:hypothetical protein